MFDQREFSARMGLAKVYLIHKGPDEEDATPRPTKDVLGSEWVGDGVRIEANTLIGYFDEQIVGRGLKGHSNVLTGVVGVAMKDGVHDSFPDGHGDVATRVFIETDALGVLFCCSFRLIDAGE